jgi:peroxiredoxin
MGLGPSAIPRAARALLLLAALTGGEAAVTAGVAAALEIGQRAPDFTLPSTTGRNVSLLELRGKKIVLLEFYGGVESPTCSANLTARKLDHEKFQALGVQILGISNEHTFTQRAFVDSTNIPYPLLSDVGDAVIKKYGVIYGTTGTRVFYPDDVGRGAARAFFLIDREGIVRGKWLGEDMEVFPSAALLDAVRRLAQRP